MAYYPTSAAGLNYISYPVGPNASGSTITANGSNNVKGTYVQMVASSPFACNALGVFITGFTTNGLKSLFDVSTGAGGAEVVLLPNILGDGSGTNSEPAAWPIMPCAIPISTRISMRCQYSTGSSTLTAGITLIAAGATDGISTWTNYGSNTSTSGGVQIDPGGTINTKGSYAQITASSSAVTQFLLLMFSQGGNNAPVVSRWAIDLSTGAGGAEVVLIPDLRVTGLISPTSMTPTGWAMLTYIASSTRIAMRASSTINDATDRLFEAAILAGTAPSESTSGGGAWAYA